MEPARSQVTASGQFSQPHNHDGLWPEQLSDGGVTRAASADAGLVDAALVGAHKYPEWTDPALVGAARWMSGLSC